MERFDRLNIAKDYDNRIKPFNFFLVGAGSRQNRRTGQKIIPMVPFTKNQAKTSLGQPFIDYKSGRKYVGQQCWRTLDEVYSGYSVDIFEIKVDKYGRIWMRSYQ